MFYYFYWCDDSVSLHTVNKKKSMKPKPMPVIGVLVEKVKSYVASLCVETGKWLLSTINTFKRNRLVVFLV